MPKNVSKDIGIEKLCEILNVEKGKCFAIGDYYNDLPMLKNVKTTLDFKIFSFYNDGTRCFKVRKEDDLH